MGRRRRRSSAAGARSFFQSMTSAIETWNQTIVIFSRLSVAISILQDASIFARERFVNLRSFANVVSGHRLRTMSVILTYQEIQFPIGRVNLQAQQFRGDFLAQTQANSGKWLSDDPQGSWPRRLSAEFAAGYRKAFKTAPTTIDDVVAGLQFIDNCQRSGAPSKTSRPNAE